MPRRYPLLAVACVIRAVASAQPQPDNPSFESWTNAGQATQEPVSWSSLKTSDGGAFINALVPQLCWRSSDARTGQYSVNLRTVSSAVGPANGLLTNGRVHAELAVENSYMYTVPGDAQWSTPMTSRPDSLVGWLKASPQPGDRANVGALLHVDEGRLPAFGTEGNYVAGLSWKAPTGPVSEWTRFSAAFQYLNDWQPEWILFIITAGDSAGSQVGTQAWFDDLALIYNVECAPDQPAVTVAGGQAAALEVGYSTGGAPTGPTLFAVELSGPDGDFANATVIGSITSTAASGSIPCTIPSDAVPGDGYRIRVTGDSPFYASVGCALTIEVGTGVSSAHEARSRVMVHHGRLIVDAERPGRFECHASDGRMVLSDSLRAGRNEFALPAEGGILLVRVTDAQGGFVARVMVAR